MIKRQTFYNQKLAELHVHVGGACDPAILWDIAHEQGIKLPTKDFWKFVDMFTINGQKISWENFHQLFHWTELIQSSPQAMERCIHEIIGGAYRNCNITLLELSFNPMFRNRGGERDLDHIIMAALRGMDRAQLEYPVKVGLIFFLDRRLPYKKNKIIIDKAIKYHHRGVVGIDLAGMTPIGDKMLDYKQYAPLFTKAKKAGLGTCVHAGEEADENDVLAVLEYLKPDRIVHGVRAYRDQRLLAKIRESKIVLALCPSSNLKIGIYGIKNISHYKEIIQSFKKAGIKFCINTDDPEFFKTNLIKEFRLLLESKILTKEEILQANKVAFENSFIVRGGAENS
jgi:adenosine deaminase